MAASEKQTLIQTTPQRSIARAYWELARMHKFPVGSILVFWPCVWGYLLSTGDNLPEPVTLAKYIALFLLESTILHSAACTINDICDVDFDRQVERCKNRPLVSGQVSMIGAWAFLFAQVAAFFAILTIVDPVPFACATFGVFPLHALYPLMKRWTWWPQGWLGLAMNWGLPTAWLIATPNDVKSVPMWVLTFGTFCWTIVYDTIYACQDRKDDIKAGVKSTALLFGDYVKQILSLFALAFVVTLGYVGYATGQGLIYYAVTVGGCTLHLLWQLATLNINEPKDCERKFIANGDLGYIVAAGMLAQHYLG